MWRFLARVQFIFPVDRARNQNSVAEGGLVAEEKIMKKEDNHFLHNSWFVSTTMPSKQKWLQMFRNWGRWIIKFIEDLSKTQSTEFTCPQRKTEFWQTESKPSLRISPCWKTALQKLSTKIMKRIVRKTTYASRGPEVALRHKRAHKNSDVLSMPRGTQRILQNVELWPNSIRAATGQTRIYKDKQHMQRTVEFFSRGIISLPKSSSERSTKRDVYVDSCPLPK